MLALSLSIGILIDDAIVVIENIHRHLEDGEAPMTAASNGTAQIFLAVLAYNLIGEGLQDATDPRLREGR